MSGPLSIVFAALAFSNFLSARKEFVFLAFAALMITVGRLAYKSVPRFRISSCSEAERNSAYNCVSFGGRDPVDVRFYQVRVDLLGKGAVSDCCARLINVHKGKTLKWQGQAVELTFSPGIMLPSKITDILFGTKGRQWTYQPPLSEIFDGRGEYLITIALPGSTGATRREVLRFSWNDWNNSSLEVSN
jgi:hypothetical protein